MIAYLRKGLVLHVGDPPPAYLVFDEVMPNAANAAVGQVWNGSAFVAPTANSEQANLATLMAQADNAIATNLQDISDANAWIAANPGTLTAAQLSGAMRSVMAVVARGAQQSNAVIRLLRAKLDATT